MVCNLLVVVSFIYHRYLDAQDIEATDKYSSEGSRKGASSAVHKAGLSTTYVLTEISTSRAYPGEHNVKAEYANKEGKRQGEFISDVEAIDRKSGVEI